MPKEAPIGRSILSSVAPSSTARIRVVTVAQTVACRAFYDTPGLVLSAVQARGVATPVTTGRPCARCR